MSDLTKFEIKDFKIGQNLYIEASAGTGKTYTIELLVEKMLEEKIPLPEILIVTFTEKATGELRDRIRCKIEDCIKVYENNINKKNIFISALREIGNAQIYTIHSFCQSVLKNYAFETKSSLNLEVEKGNEIDNILDKYIRDVWIKEEGFENLIIDNLKIILKNVVNNYLLYYDLKIEENGTSDEEKFALKHFQEIISEWQKYKKDNNLITFTDMINLVQEKIRDNKNTSLVECLRNSYRYAIIDEFQDTNQKQWDIFSKIFLNSNRNNIVVVGDPKQSIFAFQGAEIDVYKKAIEEIREKNGYGRQLLNNYRSSEAMIEACNVLFQDLEISEEKPKGSGKNKKTEIISEKNEFFGNSGIDFTPSKSPTTEINNYKNKVFLNSDEVKPIWLAQPSEGNEYAKFAVSKIVECCKLDEKGNTALQIYDKNDDTYRNVSFSDFSVLARARTEMPFIEAEMREIGIPFYRYKDRTLFEGKECLDWIALLRILDIPDFATINRQILNKSLLSDFFRKSIDEVESEELVNPTKEPMSYILEWRKLAEKRHWAELKERIYQDTNIDRIFCANSNSINLVKLHQIGNYIFDYFFNHKVSIEEMIKHLKGLVDKTGSSDSEGDIVENTNDLDAVKIMTIHASKGLEFPVVIMVGSLIGFNNKINGPFVYNKASDDIKNNRNKYLGFTKEIYKKEVFEEWRRLMYVAYTRAKYILILPDFSNKQCWSTEKYPYYFLKARIENLRKHLDLVRTDDSNWQLVSAANKKNNYIYKIKTELKEVVDDFIDKTRKHKENSFTKSDAEKQISELQNSLPNLRTYQLSYSSISSNIKKKFGIAYDSDNGDIEDMIDINNVSENGERFDKDGLSEEDNNQSDSIILKEFKNIDKPENIVRASNNYISNENNIENCDLVDYPKGSKLGNAIHEILELIIFENYGKLNPNDIYEISELNNLIIEKFEKQSLPIKQNDNWMKLTAKILWNSLNADLPVIQGNKVLEGKTFKLKSIPTKTRKAEVEFLFDFMDSESNHSKSLLQKSSLRASERGVTIQYNDNYKKLSKLCKGFIDLLFVRKENGIDYYSILDWKSDNMSDESYSDGEALADKVAEEYTVQRVLYSYLLIKWLKQFYQNLSEEEIFEKHFGGIYYVFVRGCRADCSNGIYAQTWKNYSALEESYKNLVSELGIG